MDHETHADRHRRFQVAGIVAGSVGFVLVVGGIVRWATLAQRGGAELQKERSGPSEAKFGRSRGRRIALDPAGGLAIIF